MACIRGENVSVSTLCEYFVSTYCELSLKMIERFRSRHQALRRKTRVTGVGGASVVVAQRRSPHRHTTQKFATLSRDPRPKARRLMTCPAEALVACVSSQSRATPPRGHVSAVTSHNAACAKRRLSGTCSRDVADAGVGNGVLCSATLSATHCPVSSKHGGVTPTATCEPDGSAQTGHGSAQQVGDTSGSRGCIT